MLHDRDDQQLTSPRLRDPFRGPGDPRTSRACGAEERKHGVINVSNMLLMCSYNVQIRRIVVFRNK